MSARGAGPLRAATAGPTALTGRSLAAKLGLHPGDALTLLGAPAGWTIPGLPAGVVVRRRAGVAADVVVVFAPTRAGLRRRVAGIGRLVGADAALWVAWPRRAGGHGSDLTDNLVRSELLPTGLVDVKVAALDADWSGLKFMWRKELRAGRRPVHRPARQS